MLSLLPISQSPIIKDLKWAFNSLKDLWLSEKKLISAVTIASIVGFILSLVVFYLGNAVIDKGVSSLEQGIKATYFSSKNDAAQLSSYLPSKSMTLSLQRQAAIGYMVMEGKIKVVDENWLYKTITSTRSYLNFISLDELETSNDRVVNLSNEFITIGKRQNFFFFLLSVSQILNILLASRLSFVSYKSKKSSNNP